MQEVDRLCTHAAELRRCGRIGSVWLSERISIPASLASYVQGTGEGSTGPRRPKLARAPPLLPPPPRDGVHAVGIVGVGLCCRVDRGWLEVRSV